VINTLLLLLGLTASGLLTKQAIDAPPAPPPRVTDEKPADDSFGIRPQDVARARHRIATKPTLEQELLPGIKVSDRSLRAPAVGPPPSRGAQRNRTGQR
jgi:hypothetical protein